MKNARRKAVIDIVVNGTAAIQQLDRVRAKREAGVRKEMALLDLEIAKQRKHHKKSSDLVTQRARLDSQLARMRAKHFGEYKALLDSAIANEKAFTAAQAREFTKRQTALAGMLAASKAIRDKNVAALASIEHKKRMLVLAGQKGVKAITEKAELALAAVDHKARMAELARQKGTNIKREVEAKRHAAAMLAVSRAEMAAIMPRSFGGPGRARKGRSRSPAAMNAASSGGGIRGSAPSPRAGVGPSGGFGYMGVGGGLAVAGMAAFGGGMAAKSAASEFLQQEIAVQRMMSLVNSEEKKMGFTLERGRKAAQDLARTLGVDVAEAAMIMRRAITAAVNPADAQAAAEVGHGLAVIEGADPEKVTQMLATVRNAFGSAAGSFQDISNIIFTGVDEGLVKLEETSSILGNLAASTATVGFSFKEVMSAHTALTRGGMSGARAGTALRSFAEILMKPPTASVKEARTATGLDNALATGDMDLVETLEAFKAAADNSDYSMTELLGGRQRALRALLPLTGELRDDMYDILDAMERNVDIDRRKIETQKIMNTEAMQFKRLSSAINVGWGEIGEGISSVFLDWVKEGRDVDQVIKDWSVGFNKAAQNVKQLSQFISNAMVLTKGFGPAIDLITFAWSAPARDNATVARRNAYNDAEDLRVRERFAEIERIRHRDAESEVRLAENVQERVAQMREDMVSESRLKVAIGAKKGFEDSVKSQKAAYSKTLSFLKEHLSTTRTEVNKHYSALKTARSNFESWGQSTDAKRTAFRQKIRPETANEKVVRGLNKLSRLERTADAQQSFGRTGESLKTRGEAIDTSAGFADMDLTGFMNASVDDETISNLVGQNDEFGGAPWKRWQAMTRKRREIEAQQKLMRDKSMEFTMSGAAGAGTTFSQWYAQQGISEQEKLGNTQGFAATQDPQDKLLESIAQHDRLKGLVDGLKESWRGVDANMGAVITKYDTLIERARNMKESSFTEGVVNIGAEGKELIDRVAAFKTGDTERYTQGSPIKTDPLADQRKMVYNIYVKANTPAEGYAAGRAAVEGIRTGVDRQVANPNPNK